MTAEHDKTAEAYRSFGPRVYRCCLRLLDDEEAALDATQEVFLKLVVNMSRLQDREELLPWMLNVARNHCLNVRRAARHVAVLAKDLEREEPQAGGDLTRALLARALLDRFDPAMQRVALVVLGAGFGHEDAAAALGMTPAAVARKVQRFLAKAREHLRRSQYLEAQGVAAENVPSRPRPPLTPAAPARTPPPGAKRPPPARAASAGARGQQQPGDALEPAA